MTKVKKGMVLAGGYGTRFRPLTAAVNKHLLPVYDKPMIFIPISMLMLMEIREILIVTNPQDVDSFKKLLGDGSRFGTEIHYATQEEPTGLPDAILQGSEFLGDDPFAVILGDNLFHGRGLSELLTSYDISKGATIFTFEVDNPKDFGVALMDEDEHVTGLVEKPEDPLSNWAVTGLYVFDSNALEYSRTLTAGQRGETEIVDLLNKYLADSSLDAIKVPRGITWLDMGTPDNLLYASEYLSLIDRRQRLKVAVLEEIAWRSGWISLDELRDAIRFYDNSPYGSYLSALD